MHSQWLKRGWTAAGALVAAALLASLPTTAVARVAAVADAGSAVVRPAHFDTLSAPSTAAATVSPPPAPVEAPSVPPPAPAVAIERTSTPVASRDAVARPPVERSAAAGAGTWAFIVGIDDYPGDRHDLSAAVADAKEVQEAMLLLGTPPQQILTLNDSYASAEAIRSGLDWLTANAGPDAIAVFFYAGHVTKERSETEALVGADGRRILDREVAHRLARMAARRAWLAIAACYGGGFTELMAPGRVLTGAAPANAPAYENNQLGRSYMVEYMVRQAIVEGRAAESVQAAFAYATAALARDYPERQPVQFDASDGPLDLRAQREEAPPPDAGSPPPTTTPPTTTPPPPSCSGLFCRD